jgi:hypothetical protein
MKKNHNSFRLFIPVVLLLILFFVNPVTAETIIAWDFAGCTGEEFSVEAQFNHDFLAETDSSFLIRRGPGIQHAPNSHRFNANNWAVPDLLSAIEQGDYFEWEVYPINGSVLTLLSVSMNIERSSTGPPFFTLRSSLDDFSTDLGTWEITSSAEEIVANLSSCPEIKSRIVFRLYGYGNTSTAGSAGFEGPGYDLTVEGTLVSEVPLPRKLKIHAASGSEMTLQWGQPAGILNTDWSGFYLFVKPDESNTLDPDLFNGSSANPHYSLTSASIHEGSYCVGHITDTTTESLIVSGIEEDRIYYITAYAYLLDQNDTLWSVQAPEKSLRYYSIVINEILADPPTDISGDANGDGIRHASEDEFIELVNTSDVPADLSSWMIGDADQVRHVFPHGTVIPPGEIFIVFGGGNPNLPETNAQIYLSSSGTLSLNNTHERVSLLTYDSTLIASHTWETEGNQDQSIVRNPALTGDFILHTTLSGTDLFSPGVITNYENSLPVSLADFSGNTLEYTVHLTWHTESETENAGFSITRQYEDKEPILLANFTSNPELKGQGSSTERHDYHFTDYPVQPGIYSYWLSDHSYDGTITTHFHKKVRIPYGLTITPYPNPFNTSFHVPLRLAEPQEVSIDVINLLGQTLISLNRNLEAGTHEIPVHMEKYYSGIYILRVTTKEKVYLSKIIYLK